jgi:ABC-type polysaccharide transport system permease subunit
MMIPGIVFFAVFKYIPIYGLRIAFMDYNMSVVSGNRSINERDRYVADFKAVGLDRIMVELKTVYDKQRLEQQQYLSQF